MENGSFFCYHLIMNEKFLKPYDPTETEARINKKWEDSGYCNPDNLPERHVEPFSIVLPPPNVTGQLHTGHAIMLAIQDIMVRYARMQGKKALWLPGTDHAAIATQAKVEKDIYKKEDPTIWHVLATGRACEAHCCIFTRESRHYCESGEAHGCLCGLVS